MPRKRVHVLNTLGLPTLRRRPANASTERNTHAGDLPLKRPKHQFFVAIEVKTCPVQVVDLGVEKRRKLRGVGNEVTLVGQ